MRMFPGAAPRYSHRPHRCRTWEKASEAGDSHSRYHYVQKSGARCPLGYRNTRGPWCYQRNDRELPAASTITRQGSSCPLGYRKQGDYCVKR